MNVYQLCPADPTSPAWYFATFAEVKAACRRHFTVVTERHEVEVRLIDTPNDKAALVAALNHDTPKVTHLRTWRLSDRGSFIEITTQGETL